jgi:DNA-binding NarL/FixJ family response regulator
MSTTCIGETLDGIPEGTVRHHIRTIIKRMGAEDRAQVVAWVLTRQVRPVESSD